MKAPHFFPVCAALLALPACTTTFTDASKLPCVVTHRLDDSFLTVDATVTNRSNTAVTFVNHPDHYFISVWARDRSKDEFSGGRVVHYVRATKEDIVSVPPGGSITFSEHYKYRRKSRQIVEIHEPVALDEPEFMRVWDTHLRAVFHYETHPDYLPKHAGLLARNYMMAEIHGSEVFPAP